MEFNYLQSWQAYHREHPVRQQIPPAEWGGGDIDLSVGLETVILEFNEVVAVSAWAKITALQELQIDRIAITGIPGEHGPLQWVTPDQDHQYQFPGGDSFPAESTLNACLQGRKRLSAGEILEGYLLAYVQGTLPLEEHHDQRLRIELHVLAPDGKGGRRQRHVLSIEHEFPVVCYKHEAVRVPGRAARGSAGERPRASIPVPSTQSDARLLIPAPDSRASAAEHAPEPVTRPDQARSRRGQRTGCGESNQAI